MNTYTCTGCGLKLNSKENNLDERYLASYACRKLCSELTTYTLLLQDPDFIHQIVVDTYTAQHVGNKVKPIGVAFALIGLCLVFEHGFTGKRVQKAHMILSKKSKIWPEFRVPIEKAAITIQDVIQSPDEKKKDMIMTWAKSVWNIWKSEQQKVAMLVEKYLEI